MDRSAREQDLTTLADPTRARILRLIRESDDGRMLVGRLADALGLRQPTVSHHMKALHDEGIVVREPDGRRTWYSIAPGHLERVDALLGRVPVPVGQPDLERVAPRSSRAMSSSPAARSRPCWQAEPLRSRLHDWPL